MNKSKLGMIVLVAVALLAVAIVQAESDKRVQPAKITPKAVTEIKPTPSSISQMPVVTGSKETYQMVTDVLDGFGGESESDNYRIKVNSGGQPSAIGVSEGGSYVVETGHVHASFVMRGDATGDGMIDVADVLYLVNYLFLGTSAPCPMEAGDVTCDGIVDVADVLFIINYLFLGTSPPGC
jgi:hypothetical protein